VSTRNKLAAATVAALLIAACGSDEKSATDTTAEAPATTAAPTTAPPAQTTAAPADTDAPETTEAAPETTAAPADECGEPATGEPIKFGHINSTSGPINIPSAGYAVEVFFEQYNECGGFNGRPLELLTLDGGLDPNLSAASLRQLAEQDGVIGFVGNNAFLDCFNGQYYVDNGLANIGSNFDGSCFTNPNVFPTLPNYDRNIFPSVQWAFGEGSLSFAYVALDIPGQKAQAEALKAYIESQGGTLDTTVFVPFGSADATTAMQTIRQSGVDTVIMSVDEVLFASAVSAAVQQEVGPTSLRWLAPTGLYSPKALALLGPAAEGLYVNVNYDVVENGNPTAAQLAEDIETLYPDAEVDGFAQLGWIAAETLAAALETIDGELTKESLLEAMNNLGPVTSELLPNPITVNSPAPRNLDSQALVLQVKDGGYSVVSDFITYP
jgi:branched-chain amino acid transport system substrate-binding protein